MFRSRVSSFLLLVGVALLSQRAFGCEITRPRIGCRLTSCAEDSKTAFQIYSDSEQKCGAGEDALPYIVNPASNVSPRGSVVLIHGLTAGPAHMKVLAESLAREGYSVVVPILKGHGGSDDMLIGASIDEWKKDVDFPFHLAESLAKAVHIVGHSTGGMLAALDASNHPGRYQTVTGLDPFLNVKGPLGYQMKYACLAKHVWNYQTEIFAGHESFSSY